MSFDVHAKLIMVNAMGYTYNKKSTQKGIILQTKIVHQPTLYNIIGPMKTMISPNLACFLDSNNETSEYIASWSAIAKRIV